MDTGFLVGIDGCRAGWIAVTSTEEISSCQIHIGPDFRSLLDSLDPESIIAVDMPIGLPDQIGKGGRGPEALIRPHLGERQSSVFSIPARAAVYAEDYSEACRTALRTSDPPRKVSRQAFHLFPKIREIDQLLITGTMQQIYEVHPELAFWRLNNENPLQTPKKIKGRINPSGMDERKNLLAAAGFDREFLDQKPPKGAAADDFLDACACLSVAHRLKHGQARSFPEHPPVDKNGLPIAIWA